MNSRASSPDSVEILRLLEADNNYDDEILAGIDLDVHRPGRTASRAPPARNQLHQSVISSPRYAAFAASTTVRHAEALLTTSAEDADATTLVHPPMTKQPPFPTFEFPSQGFDITQSVANHSYTDYAVVSDDDLEMLERKESLLSQASNEKEEIAREKIKELAERFGPAKNFNPEGAANSHFPGKLIQVLNRGDLDEVIGWMPHGRAFKVKDTDACTTDVLPRFFKQTKYASFIRQLNLWGFNRIARGTDAGAYYHELFLRGRPNLAMRMRRQKIKGTGSKSSSSHCDEPNFYKLPSMPDLNPDRAVPPLPPLTATGVSDAKTSSAKVSVRKKQPVEKTERSASPEVFPTPAEYTKKPEFSFVSFGRMIQNNGSSDDGLESVSPPELKQRDTVLIGRGADNNGSKPASHTNPMNGPPHFGWNPPCAKSQWTTECVAVTNDTKPFCQPCLEPSDLPPNTYQTNDSNELYTNAHSPAPDKDLFVNGMFDWAAGMDSFNCDALVGMTGHPSHSHPTDVADPNFNMKDINPVYEKSLFASSEFLEWDAVAEICESDLQKSLVDQNRKSYPASVTNQDVMLNDYPLQVNQQNMHVQQRTNRPLESLASAIQDPTNPNVFHMLEHVPDSIPQAFLQLSSIQSHGSMQNLFQQPSWINIPDSMPNSFQQLSQLMMQNDEVNMQADMSQPVVNSTHFHGKCRRFSL
eukprot:CCRYP_004728-RA/>CCRYP_004728-RA protein AED:0.05 eAED:0.05 QI:182/1/1/1/1/1/2/309/697